MLNLFIDLLSVGPDCKWPVLLPYSPLVFYEKKGVDLSRFSHAADAPLLLLTRGVTKPGPTCSWRTCEWVCWQVCRHSLLTQYQNDTESFGRGASDGAVLGVDFSIIMRILEIALIGVTDPSFLFALIDFHWFPFYRSLRDVWGVRWSLGGGDPNNVGHRIKLKPVRKD